MTYYRPAIVLLVAVLLPLLHGTRLPGQDLSAQITFPGGSPTATPVVYRMADGTDLGAYTAPSAGFTQRCIRVRNPALPNVLVDFRPDVGSGRVEVVFWNGECMGTVPDGYANNLPGYTAVITQDGVVIHRESVPQHLWGCRWRFQSSPRPVIRTAAQVVADGFLPAMSRSAARIDGYTGVIVPATPAPVAAYTTFMPVDAPGPNTKLGLQAAIDTGGERNEIGLITEWEADYLLNGTGSSRDAIFAQAEMCGGDWNFYVPDQVTGASIDYKQDAAHYAAYTFNSPYGNPGQYYRIVHQEPENGWGVHEDDTHLPVPVFYVPYALTEDPYDIEGVQFAVQWTVGWGIYQRENVYGFGRIGGPTTCCSYTNEIRSLGWGIRNLAMCYKLSPVTPPRWLLPRSYYADLSQDYASVIDTLFTTSPEPLHATFRQLSGDAYFQMFEQAYALMGMGLADLVQMPATPSWNSALTFYFGMADGLLNGTSGWDHQCPQPHDLTPSSDLDQCADWASAYAHFQSVVQANSTFPTAPSPGNRQGGSMGNCSQIYAACAIAASRGIPAAAGCLAWMNTFIDANYPNQADASMGIAFYMKDGFVGTPSSLTVGSGTTGTASGSSSTGSGSTAGTVVADSGSGSTHGCGLGGMSLASVMATLLVRRRRLGRPGTGTPPVPRSPHPGLGAGAAVAAPTPPGQT